MDGETGQLSRTIRVFLLDDHEIVRRGLVDLLSSTADIVVVGEAATAGEALRRIPAARPDVAVLDARLPDGNGIDVCRDIRSAHPEVGCVILTSYDDDEALFAAVMAGAAGYLLKQIAGNRLLDAVRAVAAGRSLMDPAVTGRLLDRLRHPAEPDPRLSAADPSGARDPRSDRRGAVQQGDRGQAVPRREDREELRLVLAGEAAHAAPDAGRGLRRRDRTSRVTAVRVGTDPCYLAVGQTPVADV